MLVGVDGDESKSKALDFFAQINVKWIVPLGIPVGTLKGLVRIES